MFCAELPGLRGDDQLSTAGTMDDDAAIGNYVAVTCYPSEQKSDGTGDASVRMTPLIWIYKFVGW